MQVEDLTVLPEHSMADAFALATKTSAATLDSLILRGGKRRSLAISERRVLLIVLDVTLIVVVGYGLSWVRGPGGFPALALLFLVPWLFFAQITGMYDLATAARERVCLKALMASAGCTALTLQLIFFLDQAPGRQYFASRPKLLLIALAAPVTIGMWRLIYIRLFGAAHFERRVLIIGAGRAAETLIAAIRQNHGHGVAPVAILDDDPFKVGTEIAGVPIVGGSAIMSSVVSDFQIEEVVLAVNEPSSVDLYQGLGACYETGIAVSLVPKVYEEVTGQVPVELVGPHWFGSVQLSPSGGRMLFALKRSVDLVVSGLALIVLSPLLIGAAIVVSLSSKGPILYRQERIGAHGRRFKILKFRTMRDNAERPGEAIWAGQQDARTTPVGRWLRRTHIDELPQLLLVLKGDMSLVGPRPERPEFVHELESRIPLYRARYSMRPGIAGWAQLHYPYGASVEDALAKLRYDLYYVKNWTPFLDAGILLRTLRRVLGFRGR